MIGGSGQPVSIMWGYDFQSNFRSQIASIPDQGLDYYGVAEYGVSEYSKGTLMTELVAYPTGQGVVVQTGYEADIMGDALSIQKIEIWAKNGKVY